MVGKLKARFLDRLTAAVTLRQEREIRAKARQGFKRLGNNVEIGLLPQIYSPEHIEIADDVRIGFAVRLQAITRHNQQEFQPRIMLGRGVSLENNCTITAIHSVELGEHVMVASNVFISDHEHDYRDPHQAVQHQDLVTGGRVKIGRDTHLGQNVCIFGSVEIGEHCVIGAGAVVLKDIPPYSVVVGAPARIVKRYDHQAGEWRRTSS